MSLTKEIAIQENQRTTVDRMELHLWKEGTFLRAYDWSAWLACRCLHEFKVNKRVFKGIDGAVAFSADVGAGPVPARCPARGTVTHHVSVIICPIGQACLHGACSYIVGLPQK